MDLAHEKSGRRSARGGGGGGLARWFAPGGAALIGGALMFLLAGLVRLPGAGSVQPRNGVETNARPLPALTVTRLDWLPAGGEVRESMRLLDPTPLFMPGGRAGYAEDVSAEVADRPGGAVTETFEPALTFSDTGPARGILRPTPPQTALGALELASGSRWFDGLSQSGDASDGRLEGPPALLAAGHVDVYRRGSQERLADLALPPDSTLAAANWAPVELDVLINSAGAVSTPTVTAGSGVGEVDERVRVLAMQQILPRLRLRPGAYRLVVGP